MIIITDLLIIDHLISVFVRYLCWWMIRLSPRISSAQYQFLSAEVDIAVLTSVPRY